MLASEAHQHFLEANRNASLPLGVTVILLGAEQRPAVCRRTAQHAMRRLMALQATSICHISLYNFRLYNKTVRLELP